MSTNRRGKKTFYKCICFCSWTTLPSMQTRFGLLMITTYTQDKYSILLLSSQWSEQQRVNTMIQVSVPPSPTECRPVLSLCPYPDGRNRWNAGERGGLFWYKVMQRWGDRSLFSSFKRNSWCSVGVFWRSSEVPGVDKPLLIDSEETPSSRLIQRLLLASRMSTRTFYSHQFHNSVIIITPGLKERSAGGFTFKTQEMFCLK